MEKVIGNSLGDLNVDAAVLMSDIDQFDTCLKLGFDLFQGDYFAKPVILSGKKLSPSQLAIMQLMTLLTSDAENAEIEDSIKKDVSLCFNLLRLVNTLQSMTPLLTLAATRENCWN
jgi:c-di-GMP-related signal transduction protein